MEGYASREKAIDGHMYRKTEASRGSSRLDSRIGRSARFHCSVTRYSPEISSLPSNTDMNVSFFLGSVVFDDMPNE